jgi:hypothetical protein
MSDTVLVKPDGNCLWNAIPMALRFKDFAKVDFIANSDQFRAMVVSYLTENKSEYKTLILQQIDLSIEEHKTNIYPGLCGYKPDLQNALLKWIAKNPNDTAGSAQNAGTFVDYYIENLLLDGVWGGGIEITAISDMWQLEVMLVDKKSKEELGTIGEGKFSPASEKIKLLFNGSHYDVYLD